MDRDSKKLCIGWRDLLDNLANAVLDLTLDIF